MLRRAIPFVAAALAFGLPVHAQDPLRGDAAFTAFFHEIAVTQDFKDASPESALTITSDDWGRVKAVASDCDRQTNAIERQLGRATLDLRLTAMAGDDTAVAQARIARLQLQRSAVVSEHIRELRDALGPQFQNVSNFLNSYQTRPPYFNRPVLGKITGIAR